MRRVVLALVSALLLSLSIGSLAFASSSTSATSTSATVNTASNSTLGTILVGSNGMTLYYFKKDSYDKSACTATCEALWPPLTATGTPTAGSGVTGKLGTITLANGSKQVTYNGAPLYYFSGDKAVGDTSGEGYLSLWYVATPALAYTQTTTTLPKTGVSPLVEVVGVLLAVGGVALTLRKRAHTV